MPVQAEITSNIVPLARFRRHSATWLPSLTVASLMIGLLLLPGCSGSDSSSTPASGEPGSSASKDTASATSDSDKLVKLKLRLNWFPEAEHGGYYAALVHGFFKAEGLDVEILKGGPGVPVREEVGIKRVEFGISNADQILIARAAEADIVGVFAPLQTSPRCIMVHKKSGIQDFDGLQNLTIALNENSSFGAFLKKHAPLKGCKFVPYKGSLARFVLEDDFAQQAYLFSEPFVASKNGSDPQNLMAADFGFNPYTSVLIVHRDTISDQPDIVRRFVAASRRGWEKYLSEPSETNKHIQEQNPEMEQDILAFGAAELRPLCKTSGDTPLGSMTRKRWSEISEMLVDLELIEAAQADVDAAFENRFIESTSKIDQSGPEKAESSSGESN